MLNLKTQGVRLAMACALPLAAAGLLVPSSASAAQVAGTVTITIDNTAMAAASANAGIGYPNGWPVMKFWDASYNTTGINNSTAGGVDLPSSGSTGPLAFPVNSNAATIAYPSAGSGGRTVQATTMDAADTSTGQIGMSGAMKLSSPPNFATHLAPYDFSLVKTSGTWNLRTYDSGFGYQNFLVLANVSESLNSSGQLLLSGDLKWTGLWAAMVGGANTSTVVGTLSLAPSAVPVPAAVWLFGSALAGLAGAARRKPAASA